MLQSSEQTFALLAPNITFDKDTIIIVEPVGGKNAFLDKDIEKRNLGTHF